MPPRPVPRPHFTSLGFTWLSLRASHRLALRLLVLPPSRRAPPPRLLTPGRLSPPRLPRYPRARARAIASLCPAASLPLFIGGSSCAPRPHPFFSPDAVVLILLLCSLFLLVRPHQTFSSTVRAQEHREALLRIVSSRLVSLDSLRSFLSFSSPPSSSFLFLSALLSFRRLLFLRSPPRSLSARTARYKLFQKFVLLLLSLNHSQRRRAGDEHSSPVQCATLFAPRRLRQFDDSEGGDGDDESWTSGVSLVVSLAERERERHPRIDFYEGWLFSLA